MNDLLFEDVPQSPIVQGLDLTSDSGLSFASPAPAGIGLSPEQPAAPISTAPVTFRPPSGQDLRADAIARMTGPQKFFGALGEVGAALQGKASPLDAHIKQQREDKMLQVTELKAHVDALETGAKIAKTLTGDAKTNFVRDYTSQLDQLRPGLGGTFAHIAEQPDLLTQFQQYMPYLPEPMKLLMKTNPDAFWKIASTPEGLKQMQEARDRSYSSVATRKASGFVGNLQQLNLDPKLTEEFLKQPTASLFNKLQDALPAGHPYKLTDEQKQAAEAHPDLFYQGLGLLSPKDEAAIKVKKAERKEEGAQSTVGKIKEDLDAGRITQAEADAAIAKANKIGDGGVQIYTSSLTPGVDAQGNPVFVQGSGREGVQPRVVEGVRPADKGNPIQKAIADAIAKGGGGKPAAAVKDAKAAPAPAADVQQRFSADKNMKGYKLGAQTEEGYEVRDAKGKLLGHFK